MKNISSAILLCFSLCLAASLCYGGGIPIMNVAVLNDSNKVVFKGNTGADGSFSTGKLAPGKYVVQFNSSSPEMKTGHFALAVSAGKKRVTANDVAGKEFAGGGVGMKLDVGNGLNITGSIVSADATSGKGDARIKIVNGKRFVWVKGGELGSNLGGRWVEEGSQANMRNGGLISKDDVTRIQTGADPHQEGFPGR